MSVPRLDQRYESDILELACPATAHIELHEAAPVQTLLVQAPTAAGHYAHVGGEYGLSISSSPERSGRSARDLWEQGDLHFKGPGEIVDSRFAGEAALERLPVAPSHHATIAVVAHGFFHVISWYVPRSPVQEAILASLRFRRPPRLRSGNAV